MKINKIDQWVALRHIAERFGAKINFQHCAEPIVLFLPPAGAQSGEVVRCCVQEIEGWVGGLVQVDGQKITVNL